MLDAIDDKTRYPGFEVLIRVVASSNISQRAQAILRGVRAISDYEYELQMALMNRRLAPQVETVFLMADEKYSYVSSRLIKNVFELGGSVEGLVPETVISRLQARVVPNKPR